MTAETQVQHTPGPWSHSLTTNGDRAIYGADSTRIAEMYGNGFHRDDIEADARLIAAAPALLDAARLALTEFDAGVKSYHPAGEACAFDVLEAAIRLATEATHQG